MLHPLLHVLATQPQLLGNHAQAYTELISTEVSLQAHALARRAALFALATCLMGVSAVLCGTAVLLWSVVALQPSAPLGVLIAVPLVPALLAAAGFVAARRDSAPDKPAFSELRHQIAADMALLRAVGAS
jgi:hypothetical protein